MGQLTMHGWDVDLDVNPQSKTTLFQQIVQAICQAIAGGRLEAGDRLPGSRRLAATLGVHRNTVVIAYEALVAEGWLTVRPAGGTFVAPNVRDEAPPPVAKVVRARGPGYALSPAPASVYPWQRLPPFFDAMLPVGASPSLSLNNGVPDVRMFPRGCLTRAYRRALREEGSLVLGFGDSRGNHTLRMGLAGMMAARRHVMATPEQVLIARGGVMALRLVAEAVLQPGDTVAVEDPGYPGAWEALHAFGARLVPVPVDAEGLDVEALQSLCEAGRPPIKALFVTPHHQYPTTVVMSAARRLALMRLAVQHRFPIIEDDYDHDFHYDGRPVQPLASQDPEGMVIYVGSMSKMMAPGLRIGFVIGHESLINQMALRRRHHDVQGDLATELAVAFMGQEGEIARHVRRMRRAYNKRRDALARALTRHLGQFASFELPAGGMHLWVRTPPELNLDSWVARCAAEGVDVCAGRRFSFGAHPINAMRLSYAALNEAELEEAVRRMAKAVQRRAA